MGQETKNDVQNYILNKMRTTEIDEETSEPQIDEIFNKNISCPSPEEEIRTYEILSRSISNINIAEFWKNSTLSRLKIIDKEILSMRVSGASSERHFSCAGETIGNKRTKMSSKTLIAATFIKSNRSIVKKHLEEK